MLKIASVTFVKTSLAFPNVSSSAWPRITKRARTSIARLPDVLPNSRLSVSSRPWEPATLISKPDEIHDLHGNWSTPEVL